jgi:hypothetical protein
LFLCSYENEDWNRNKAKLGGAFANFAGFIG